MLLPLPSRPANDTAHGRRGDVSRWSRPRRASTGFCRATETMLPVGLVRGGLLRGFAGPPRRCFPMGSSEAASHGIFQRRHCAQRRRSLLSFSPPPPGERMPRVRSRPCEPAGSPFPFPHFPARPSHASSFTQPPGQRYRARSPRRCFPMVSSEAGFLRAFAGSPRRCLPMGSSEAASPAGFSNAAKAMLPVGLVRGGLLRGFAESPRRCFPLGSSETAFCGVLRSRRDDASRWARPRRPSAGFCRAAAAVLPDGLV